MLKLRPDTNFDPKNWREAAEARKARFYPPEPARFKQLPPSLPVPPVPPTPQPAPRPKPRTSKISLEVSLQILEIVLEEVCKELEAKADEIEGDLVEEDVVLARSMYSFQARRHTSLKYETIGERIHKTNVTVANGITRINLLRAKNLQVRDEVERISTHIRERARTLFDTPDSKPS